MCKTIRRPRVLGCFSLSLFVGHVHVAIAILRWSPESSARLFPVDRPVFENKSVPSRRSHPGVDIQPRGCVQLWGGGMTSPANSLGSWTLPPTLHLCRFLPPVQRQTRSFASRYATQVSRERRCSRGDSCHRAYIPTASTIHPIRGPTGYTKTKTAHTLGCLHPTAARSPSSPAAFAAPLCYPHAKPTATKPRLHFLHISTTIHRLRILASTHPRRGTGTL